MRTHRQSFSFFFITSSFFCVVPQRKALQRMLNVYDLSRTLILDISDMAVLIYLIIRIHHTKIHCLFQNRICLWNTHQKLQRKMCKWIRDEKCQKSTKIDIDRSRRKGLRKSNNSNRTQCLQTSWPGNAISRNIPGITPYWCSLNYLAPLCGAWPLCVKNAADFAFLSFYSSFSEASA